MRSAACPRRRPATAWPGWRTRCRSAVASSAGGRAFSLAAALGAARPRGPPLNGWLEMVMKSAEYRGMSDEHLELTRREVVKNLFHLRFQSATERLETPSEIQKAKRELARIMTIQRERQLAAQKTGAAKE